MARRVLKYGASAWLILAAVHYYADRRLGQEPDAWYEGSWKVTGFTRDGQDVPAGVAGATRWSRIRFQIAPPSRYVRWILADGSPGSLYTFTVDDKAQTMTLEPAAAIRTPTQGAEPMALHYVRRDANHLALDGTIDGATLAVELERFDSRSTQLMSRGFHWISEEAFNR